MNGILLVLAAMALLRLPRMMRQATTALSGFLVVDGKDITVTDGDSITIAKRRCRVIGHDSPEWDQPQGPAARAALRAAISGQCIVVPVAGDVYGRALVHVFSSKAGLVSWRMVKDGHGFADTWLLWPTMVRARWKGVGMWGTRSAHGLVRPNIWRLGSRPPGTGGSHRC